MARLVIAMRADLSAQHPIGPEGIAEDRGEDGEHADAKVEAVHHDKLTVDANCARARNTGSRDSNTD